MATSIFIPPSIWKPARWPEKTDSFVGTSPQQLSRSKLEKKNYRTQEKKRGNRLSRRPGAWTQRANCPPWKSLKNARICFVFHHQNEQNNISLIRKYIFLIFFDYIRKKKKGMCVDVTHHSQRGLKAAFLTSATSRREVLVRSNSRYRSIEHMLA